ncbi:MAG: carbohydrate-binding domain-containing protein, partial [Candidatus Bathyarchaeia archaeon]
NGVIIINSGTFNIATGDDAIHADTSLDINDGTFTISKCYEGLESSVITIDGGYIQIVSSDDGINAGEESFSFGRPGGGSTSTGSSYYLKINGGIIVIDAYGDGIDINGYIEMTDGLLVINGPISNNNGPIDYDKSFQISGGTVIASGSSGMAQAPGSGSQYAILVKFSTPQQANTLVNIQTASGETVLTFRPTKTFQSLAFSSPDLDAGSYVIYLGGSSTGTVTNGVYEGGAYTPGTQYTTFTLS